MKDLCPAIYRQRLIVEGLYTAPLSKRVVRQFIRELSLHLGMTIVVGPLVKDVAGDRDPKHKGYECIAVWTESGVALYVWEQFSFFSLDIYTCKKFKISRAVAFVRKYMRTTRIEHHAV